MKVVSEMYPGITVENLSANIARFRPALAASHQVALLCLLAEGTVGS